MVPTGCEGKVSRMGEKLATLPATVPVNATSCGLLLALSLIASAAVSLPDVTVGANVTVMVQVAAGLTTLPQVFD